MLWTLRDIKSLMICSKPAKESEKAKAILTENGQMLKDCTPGAKPYNDKWNTDLSMVSLLHVNTAQTLKICGFLKGYRSALNEFVN